MTKPTKPKGPMAPPRKAPVWTEVRLQAPMLAAAQHTCSTVVARPPAASGDLTARHVAVIVGALALLANTEDLMIWLICHPSNSYVQERRRVMLKDLKGASAIRQDVSDGIVIERGTVKKATPWCHAIVHLDKVRSEFGQGGQSVTMPFDPIALHYADSPSNLPTYKGGGLPVDPDSVKD